LNAYIVDAVRTAGGKKNGSLAKVHSTDLGAIVLNALVDRNHIDPSLIDDVIFGCLSQLGSQGLNVARNCVLSSKLPITVPGTTVDRQCGSSLQAIHFAAQAVMSGTQDVVIAGGVENMSTVPMGSTVTAKPQYGIPKGKEMEKKWPGILFSQFEGAEILAKNWQITRKEMEDLAVSSHERAHNATTKGYFQKEIIPVEVTDANGKVSTFTVDEGVRYPIDKEKLSKLPLLKPDGGRITAAISSQITDGASAVLIVNERGLKKLGVKPRAKFVGLSVVGSDPVEMLGGPIPATKILLQKTGLTIDQIDLYEVNEAFAPVPLAWLKALNADKNKLNVNGGAMALGHPIGATGGKLMATLLNELERRNGKYGLIVICEGGGTANAAIIENIDQKSKL
jgi:acetyl-CoA acetyltransferase family protein